MNAPTTATQLAHATMFDLPLESLVASKTHVQEMRRKRFDPAKLAELAESIRKVGVLQPIVARTLVKFGTPAWPDGGTPTKCEIVAGERRWLAAKLAGIATIPANVTELPDGMILEVQLIENLQREGLHEMEEAEGYDELMKLRKITADEVAVMVGKSRSYVYARLKLLQLGREARDRFYAGELDASRALEIARIADPERQGEALSKAAQKDYNGKFMYSVRMLRAALGADGHIVYLKHAPFPITDPTLIKAAGSCTTCPHRAGNATTPGHDEDPDVCTSVACYHDKVKAESERRRSTLMSKGKKPLKGDEAKKIVRGRQGSYVGHVDLDQACEYVEFPEKEPQVDGMDEDESPEHVAWSLREQAWKPPTYRQLLEGATVPTLFIEDHRSKRCHELAPIKEVSPLLKKKGIALPSYVGAKPPEHHATRQAAPAAPKSESPEAKAKRIEKEEKEKAEAALKAEIDKALADRYPEALFLAARKNYPKALSRRELQLIAAHLLSGLEDYHLVCKSQGWKPLNWLKADEATKRIASHTEAQLGPLMLDCLLQRAYDEDYNDNHENLEAAVAAFKVNPAAIRKAIEDEIRGKLAPKTAAGAAKPGAKAKAAPKKKAGKSKKK